MTFGFLVNNSSGVPVMSPDTPGGSVYLQTIVQQPFTTSTYNFPRVPDGSYLHVVQIGPGGHYFVVGTSNGQATLTVTNYNKTYPTSTSPTTLLVFATYTVEVDTTGYGISVINNSGQRLVSGVYPTPQFVRKLPQSAFNLVSNGNCYQPNNYAWYQAGITIPAVSSGQARYIMMNLPGGGDDTWYELDLAYIEPSYPGDRVIVMNIFSTVTPKLPELFVFTLSASSAGSDTFGLRIFDSSGNITFDSGRQNMVISQVYSGSGYPLQINTIQTYANAFVDANPVIGMPQFNQERIIRTAPNSGQSYDDYYFGASRRVGTTLQTQLFWTQRFYEDFAGPTQSTIFNNGRSNSLFVQSLPGSLYGASSL
jgi:hypothetical protein